MVLFAKISFCALLFAVVRCDGDAHQSWSWGGGGAKWDGHHGAPWAWKGSHSGKAWGSWAPGHGHGPHEPMKKILIDSPASGPVGLVFRSMSSPVEIKNVHISSHGTLKHTASHDGPSIYRHTVTRPVVSELHELITPIRLVKQSVLPVHEEAQSKVHSAKDWSSAHEDAHDAHNSHWGPKDAWAGKRWFPKDAWAGKHWSPKDAWAGKQWGSKEAWANKNWSSKDAWAGKHWSSKDGGHSSDNWETHKDAWGPSKDAHAADKWGPSKSSDDYNADDHWSPKDAWAGKHWSPKDGGHNAAHWGHHKDAWSGKQWSLKDGTHAHDNWAPSKGAKQYNDHSDNNEASWGPSGHQGSAWAKK